jgi:hypothetical protein
MSKKIKKEIIIRYTHEQLFNVEVVLVVSEWKDFLDGATEFVKDNNYKELEEMYKGHGEDISCLGTMFPFDGGGCVIWIKNDEKIGTLVHEITHAVQHILKKRAIPLVFETEEVYAYLTEYLFNSLIKK